MVETLLYNALLNRPLQIYLRRQEEKLLNQPCKWLEKRLLELTEHCLAVLGCRDEPTDAVLEYCQYLAKALVKHGIELKLAASVFHLIPCGTRTSALVSMTRPSPQL